MKGRDDDMKAEFQTEKKEHIVPTTEEISPNNEPIEGDMIVNGKIRSTDEAGIGATNPEDNDTAAYLGFSNNTARIRLRGDGLGADGPFQIQGRGDSVRLSVEEDGTIINGALDVDKKVTAPEFIGDLTGNATTASTLETARTINGVPFDGSESINITANPSAHSHPISQVTNLQTELNSRSLTTHSHTPAQIGAAPTTHNHTWNQISDRPTIPTASTTNPVAPGTAAIGTGTTFARADHRHPLPTLAQIGAAPTTHNHTWNQISDRPTTFPPATHAHSWDSITERPATFAPSAHNHTWSQISDRPTIPTAATTNPVAPGTAAVGTGATFARADHRHPLPTLAQIGAAPATHTHNATDVNAGTLNIARIPTGTTSTTVSLGNHTHTPTQIGATPLTGTSTAEMASSVTHTVSATEARAFIDNLPQHLTGSVTVNVLPGTTPTDIRINNRRGPGVLTVQAVNASGTVVDLGAANLTPRIVIQRNACTRIVVRGFRCTTDNNTAVHINDNSCEVEVRGIEAIAGLATNTANVGIRALRGSGVVWVRSCRISNKNRAFWFGTDSPISVRLSGGANDVLAGVNNTTFIRAETGAVVTCTSNFYRLSSFTSMVSATGVPFSRSSGGLIIDDLGNSITPVPSSTATIITCTPAQVSPLLTRLNAIGGINLHLDIHVTPGTTTDTWTIQRWRKTGILRIRAVNAAGEVLASNNNHATHLVNRLSITDNSNTRIEVHGFRFTVTNNSCIGMADNKCPLHITSCNSISGVNSDASGRFLDALRSGYIYVTTCTISNKIAAFRVRENTELVANSTAGTNNVTLYNIIEGGHVKERNATRALHTNLAVLATGGTFNRFVSTGPTGALSQWAPHLDANVDLGTSAIRFRDGHFSRNITAPSFIGNATSAQQLQTNRTINGTNFNGTANITTANWGTGRNITIGNHTVTGFNGSGNLSMTLAQIGAAATTHTHSAGDITSGTLPIVRGGTGATTAAATRNALGLGNTTGALPIANGGTGATTAANARTGLGLTNTAVSTSAGQFRIGNLLIQTGMVTITPTPNAPTTVAIRFPQAYHTTPNIQATASTSVPGSSVLGVGASAPTTTGFNAVLTRTNSTATGFRWLAIGMIL